MESRPTGAGNRANNRRKSATYQLKLELRRLERGGRGHSLYANAIRRVLRAFSRNDLDAVIRLLEEELRTLEQDSGADDAYTAALRKAVSLIEPEEHADRLLFSYYLRKMESEGRGDEPFARALRRALESPDGPTLETLFVWRERHEE